MRIQPVNIQNFQVQENPAINGLDPKYDTPQFGFLKHAEYTQILSNIDPNLVNAIYNDPNLSQLDISCILSLTAAYGLDAQTAINLAHEVAQLPAPQKNVDYLIVNSIHLPPIPAPIAAPAAGPVINQADINAARAKIQANISQVLQHFSNKGVRALLEKKNAMPPQAALQQLAAAQANPDQALNLNAPEFKEIRGNLKSYTIAFAQLQNAHQGVVPGGAPAIVRVDARVEDARASFNSFIDLYIHAHADNRRNAGPLLNGRQVIQIAQNGFLPLPAAAPAAANPIPVPPPMPAPAAVNPIPVAPAMPAPAVANPIPVAPAMPAPAAANPIPVAPAMPAPAVANPIPAPAANAGRGALLAQIQAGRALRANPAPAANANPAPAQAIPLGLAPNPAPAANQNPAPAANANRGALFAQIQAGRKLRPGPAPDANANAAPGANPEPNANANPAPAANPVPAPKAAPADHGEALALAIAQPKLKAAPKAAPKQDNVPAPADFRHVLKRAPSQPVVKQPEAPAPAPKAEARPLPKRANSVPVKGKNENPIPKIPGKKLAPKMPENMVPPSPILPPVIHLPQEPANPPMGDITHLLFDLIDEHERENANAAPVANPAPNPDPNPAPVANPAPNPDPIRAESMRNLMGALQNPPQLRPAAERPVNDPILPQGREEQIAQVVTNRRAAMHQPEDDAEIDPSSLVISFLANAPEPAQPQPVAAPVQRPPAGPPVGLNNLQAAFENMQVGALLREELERSFNNSFDWAE